MSADSSVIETLRAARGSDDLIERLRAGSLEARRERLAEALHDPSWDGGPAELVATYPHHVLALKEGVLMRIALVEEKDAIKFGKVEVFDIPKPVADVGSEVMETARCAAELVLKEDYTSASPMIKSIAGALDLKGDLQRKVELDVGLRAMSRKSWWHNVVEERFEGEPVQLPAPRTEGADQKALVAGSIDDLTAALKEHGSAAITTLQALSERESVHPGTIECARDITEDLKNAISVLSQVNRDDHEEMSRVYEAVGNVAPRLLNGIKFLSQLANG